MNAHLQSTPPLVPLVQRSQQEAVGGGITATPARLHALDNTQSSRPLPSCGQVNSSL